MAKIVAKVYSDALFELAIERSQIDQVAEEIQAVKEAFLENAELQSFMDHPKISNEEKVKMIEDIFKDRLSDTTVGFLVIVVTKSRYNEFEAMFDYFLNEVREYKKIGKASVVSAAELTQEQKKNVEAKLLELTDYVEFIMDYKIDPSIIGGLIIRIGDRVVDSSIKSKLELMKKDLMKLQLAN